MLLGAIYKFALTDRLTKAFECQSLLLQTQANPLSVTVQFFSNGVNLIFSSFCNSLKSNFFNHCILQASS